MAETNKCPQCGAPISANITECPYCGEAIAPAAPVAPVAPAQPVYQQPVYQQPVNNGVDPSWPIKSKVAAGILAIFFGGLGIHKFYLGKVGLGILYLLFCWTYIPEVIGLIEGIIYLCSDDHNFQVKNHVRLQ